MCTRCLLKRDGSVLLLVLRWTEKDGPAVRKPTRQGFGTRVIERMVGQLKGKADFKWRPDGLICEITVQV
jgi:two-component sensor histidine kinase